MPLKVNMTLEMRSWRLWALAGCGLWPAACVEALAPQPGEGSASMRTATPTTALAAPNFGFAPLPTARMGNDFDLRRRQDASEWGEICGYVSGDLQSPFGCAASSACRTDTIMSVVYCCPKTLPAGVSCVGVTACLDWDAFSSLTETRVTSISPIPAETGWW